VPAAAASSSYEEFRAKLDRGEVGILTIYPTVSELEYDGDPGLVPYPRGKEDEIIKAARKADVVPAVVNEDPAADPLDNGDDSQPWPLYVIGFGLILAAFAITVRLVRAIR
jgi:hypothetical protein